MKKYFIVLLSGITAASFVFSGCGGKTNANSSLSSTQEKRFSFNLDKDYSFGDLSLKIDSKWKLTETKDVSVFLINDSITLSMTKAEFNNSLMSEDDVFEIHSEPDSEHMVDTISNEKVSGNNVMLYSFIPTSKGNNEEYSRHLVTVIEDFSYDIYAKSKYADWQNCNSVIYELFKSLKMPQAKEESTDAALIQSTTEKTTEAPTEKPTESPADSVPLEYKNALRQAQSYNRSLHMSKAALYDHLTSKYGAKFPADAAQYAIDNIDADWNENALKSAENYNKSLHLSKAALYNQLTSEYGAKFTQDQAQYAVDNLNADYKLNALESAKSYIESLGLSKDALYDQLTSKYGGQFTAEEAQYAIDNIY